MKKPIRNGLMFFVFLIPFVFNSYGQESCTFSGSSSTSGNCTHTTMQISCDDGASCSFQWGVCGSQTDEVLITYFVGGCNQ
jgi:hypothetical protein